MPGISTWPTVTAGVGWPTGTSPGGSVGIGTETVFVERVSWSKGGISERRPAFGVPEGNLYCNIKPAVSRNYEVYEHSMDEQFIRYMAQFTIYPDVRARDRLIWLDVGGSGITKTLTVVALDFDSTSSTWTARCEEHTN